MGNKGLKYGVYVIASILVCYSKGSFSVFSCSCRTRYRLVFVLLCQRFSRRDDGIVAC
jgi:hypothetical protein